MTGPTIYVLPDIGDDMPARLKDALAIRNVANTTGRCPRCGATAENEDGTPFDWVVRPGQVVHAYYRHENYCTADNDSIAELEQENP